MQYLPQSIKCTYLCSTTFLQIRLYSNGGIGAAAAGMSLSEHQFAGGEFPQHAASAAGG